MNRATKSILGALAAAVMIAVGVAATGACNNQADCPAKASIQPGGACSDDDLQCAYDLVTPAAACDGTRTTIASSCVCTKGAWSCPSAYSCEASAGDGGDDGPAEAGDDGPAETGDDGPAESGDDGGADAPTG